MGHRLPCQKDLLQPPLWRLGTEAQRGAGACLSSHGTEHSDSPLRPQGLGSQHPGACCVLRAAQGPVLLPGSLTWGREPREGSGAGLVPHMQQGAPRGRRQHWDPLPTSLCLKAGPLPCTLGWGLEADPLLSGGTWPSLC